MRLSQINIKGEKLLNYYRCRENMDSQFVCHTEIKKSVTEENVKEKKLVSTFMLTI